MPCSNSNSNWGTCIAPATRRPRAHHRVNPYPDARRQNETEMFLDHDETSPSIAAVSAPSVACSMLAVQQQRRLCRQFVDVSAARRGCHTMHNESAWYMCSEGRTLWPPRCLFRAYKQESCNNWKKPMNYRRPTLKPIHCAMRWMAMTYHVVLHVHCVSKTFPMFLAITRESIERFS